MTAWRSKDEVKVPAQFELDHMYFHQIKKYAYMMALD